jgi:hypothetical protein
MSAGQREWGVVVVKACRLPCAIAMATCAAVIQLVAQVIGAQGSCIVCLMATITLFGRSFESSGVAIVAAHIDVRACQRIRSGIMIKAARLPARGAVTGCTGDIEIA